MHQFLLSTNIYILLVFSFWVYVFQIEHPSDDRRWRDVLRSEIESRPTEDVDGNLQLMHNVNAYSHTLGCFWWLTIPRCVYILSNREFKFWKFYQEGILYIIEDENFKVVNQNINLNSANWRLSVYSSFKRNNFIYFIDSNGKLFRIDALKRTFEFVQKIT